MGEAAERLELRRLGQREVLPRVSVEVGYFRRWWGNFVVTDNLAVATSDFTPFSVVAPADPRLPDGGGNTISGLYDVDPSKFGQTNNFITLSSNYGNQYENFNAVDVTVNARMKNGLTFQGGTSTGQGVTDNCEIKSQLPEISPTNPYCHTATGFLTQFRGLGSYTVPKIDVLLSGTFQSVQGPVLAANYALPAGRDDARRSAARPPAPSILTVNLVAPGDAVWRSDQPAGLPRRKDPEVREDADAGVGGRLQRLEFRGRSGLESGVHPRRRVADAELGADGALRPNQRTVRFLVARVRECPALRRTVNRAQMDTDRNDDDRLTVLLMPDLTCDSAVESNR